MRCQARRPRGAKSHVTSHQLRDGREVAALFANVGVGHGSRALSHPARDLHFREGRHHAIYVLIDGWHERCELFVWTKTETPTKSRPKCNRVEIRTRDTRFEATQRSGLR